MVIIGLDCSTNKTGIGVFKNGKYQQHALIDCKKVKDVYERIDIMVKSICDYLDGVKKIDKIILEETMLRSNIDTVKKLAYIAGGIMAYAYSRNIELEFKLPSQWRKEIGLSQGGSVKREILKEEAILAVKVEYNIEATDDECEAILIARSGFDLDKINVAPNDVWEMH